MRDGKKIADDDSHAAFMRFENKYNTGSRRKQKLKYRLTFAFKRKFFVEGGCRLTAREKSDLLNLKKESVRFSV